MHEYSKLDHEWLAEKAADAPRPPYPGGYLTSLRAVADYIGCTPQTVKNRASRGDIFILKVKGHYVGNTAWYYKPVEEPQGRENYFMGMPIPPSAIIFDTDNTVHLGLKGHIVTSELSLLTEQEYCSSYNLQALPDCEIADFIGELLPRLTKQYGPCRAFGSDDEITEVHFEGYTDAYADVDSAIMQEVLREHGFYAERDNRLRWYDHPRLTNKVIIRKL